MTDNERIVRDFVAAWAGLDPTEIASYFAEDGCYYNIPAQPVRGRANIEQMIRGFMATWTAADFELSKIAAAGDLVVTERIDRIKTSRGDVDLPCAGIFEMENGKIKEWRDYFDMNTFTSAMK
jgi:limonene-1,2-epoxide hydrolase